MTFKTSRKSQPRTQPKLLTEAELELMNILWKLQEASVNDVISGLGRELAYTSVSTILRILEQKGFVSSRPRPEGRGHLYSPRVAKKDYEAASLQQLVTKVFDGTPSGLVRRLLEDEEISEAELEQIRNLLNEKLGPEGSR